MRIIKRNEFLALPAGVVYSKGKSLVFGNLSVKGDTCENGNDWFYSDPAGIDFDNTEQFVSRMDAMLNEGASFPCDTTEQRDGCFDGEEIFLVFEQGDLFVLRNLCDRAIELTPSFTPMPTLSPDSA